MENESFFSGGHVWYEMITCCIYQIWVKSYKTNLAIQIEVTVSFKSLQNCKN